MRRTNHKHTLNLTYFIYYAIIQGMSEQFITPTQPEDKLKDTPGNGDWGAVADTSREASSDRGSAMDLPILREAVGLPPKEEKITPDSNRELAMDSPILRKAVGLPPEPESESADKQN